MYEFQFFPPRLAELLEKETNAFIAAQKILDSKKKDETSKEEVEESLELTPEEQKEKEELLEQVIFFFCFPFFSFY